MRQEVLINSAEGLPFWKEKIRGGWWNGLFDLSLYHCFTNNPGILAKTVPSLPILLPQSSILLNCKATIRKGSFCGLCSLWACHLIHIFCAIIISWLPLRLGSRLGHFYTLKGSRCGPFLFGYSGFQRTKASMASYSASPKAR
jgi:hypothetical protein